MDIVSWIFEKGGYDHDKPIFLDTSSPETCISASQARKLIRKLVSGFRANGLRTGDYVCILSYNHVNYPILFLGIIAAGGCVTGCNPSHTSSELAIQLRSSRVKYIITGSQMYEKALATASECDIPTSSLYICDAGDETLPTGYNSWTGLLQHGESDWVTLSAHEAETTVAVLYSTSGTTGLPKAAMMSHAHITSVASFIEQSSAGKPYKISRLISLPLFHAFAAPIVHLSSLREGIPTYLLRRYDPASFVDALAKFQITDLSMVPSMLVTAVSSPFFEPRRLSSIRQVWVGGATLSHAIHNKFQRLLSSEARIVPVYGMTECGWITSLMYPESESTESVGRPVPGMGVKLVADDGKEILEDGQLGELLLHPQHPTLGYVGNAAATAELYHEPGWIRSGDVAYFRDGKYFIVDRKKDLIKVRSWQVSPAELENVLLQHPLIADVAVIGVPDHGISGEVPHAFIVKSSTRDALDLPAIKDFMCRQLARYKQIEGLSFVDSVPRNPTGKILRRILRDEFLQRQPCEIGDTDVERENSAFLEDKKSDVRITVTEDVNCAEQRELKHTSFRAFAIFMSLIGILHRVPRAICRYLAR